MYRHNDCYVHSCSNNLGHDEIETSDCFVDETQCGGGGCASNCQNEWCVLIVQRQKLHFVDWV